VENALAVYFADALASAEPGEDAATLLLKFDVGGQIVEHALDLIAASGGPMDAQVFSDWMALVFDSSAEETRSNVDTKRARTFNE
jgi:hypothetical protein